MKLIVSDLDGTLLNEKKEITERTKNILREAYANGIDFAIASGRSQH
ncbi:MAG: HAD hydrolase family protein, partial [Fusobacterium sp.]|nr:HAD hydrolase family protein [Fusobacterium sp.]